MHTNTLPAQADTGKQVIVGINSTILFLLAYLMCHIAYQGATIMTAMSNGIQTELFPGHIQFKLFDSQWETNAVISTYAAGPFVCLALAFIFFPLFNLYKTKRGLKKVFFLWATLHGLNTFFGSMVAGTLVKGGFWYAVRWAVISNALAGFVAFIFFLVLIGIGILMAPAFLQACDSKTLMKFTNRQKMLFTTVFMPWIVGSLFIYLLKVPDFQLYEGLILLSLSLVLIPVYFMNQHNLFSQTIPAPQKTKIAWASLIILLAGALIFRLSLMNGISFG
ncbi:hypothetical protein [Adhaeribacter soli]|uniref:Uncharacterized protein n=1 Tax=Adhaeribacter soli TaxID=2607655 RepID=A0A5N1J3I1_9BACT|nr:hypothetical protein [Adhaeribacter soli]KAA9340655.1 hypothetical protein F0P94_04295 [Adhaeribacter soli]